MVCIVLLSDTYHLTTPIYDSGKLTVSAVLDYQDNLVEKHLALLAITNHAKYFFVSYKI